MRSSCWSKIQSAYQATNAPPTASATPGNTSGTASAYQTAQLSNYTLALNLLGGSSSSSSSTSSAALLGFTA